MDENRTPPATDTPSGEDRRRHRRAPVGTRAIVHQPSLWPEPVEVMAENVSLTGVLFDSQFRFSVDDLFRCRVVLPDGGGAESAEVNLAAVVVRVDDDRWETQGCCRVGAMILGLDETDEAVIRAYVDGVLATPAPGDVGGF